MANIRDKQYFINIRSNVDGAEILFGNESKGLLPSFITLSLKELQNNFNGVVDITVKKTGYNSNIYYELVLIPNPDFENAGGGFDQNPQFYGQDEFRDNSFSTPNNFNTPNNGLNPEQLGANDIFSNIDQFVIAVRKYENNQLIDFNQNFNLNTLQLDFDLKRNSTEEQLLETEDKITEVGFSVQLDGLLGSAKFIINNENELLIDKTPSIYNFNLGDVISIVSTDVSNFKITEISAKGIGVDDRSIVENTSQTLIKNITVETPLRIYIKSEEVFTRELELPSISLINSNEDRIYNLNTNTPYPIGITKNNRVDSLRVIVGDVETQYVNLGENSKFVILISDKKFDRVGVYKVKIIPRNNDGDGTPIDVSVNVVSDVWVGEPDIRNITFPSIIEGADYVGTNVDFEVSWESINTDWVRVARPGSSSFIKAPATGKVSLNIQNLLGLDGLPFSQNDNEIDITLTLIPYNESGTQVLVGKEELLQIRFSKGLLTIPRSIAINRIAEGFVSQFDSDLLSSESSKYLTHTLHLGEGDNKVITTWTGSAGSLILKLYEPLPTSVQPNQQVWISKYQSNPAIETVTISGVDGDFCSPLKGPNFSLEPDNGIGYSVYDELIASGSETSIELVNRYAGTLGIDTSKLNIQYTDDTTYLFENFVNFGSAEERVNNFFYKIKLIEDYKTKLENLTGGLNEGILLTEAFEVLLTDGESLFEFEIEKFVFRNPTEGIEAGKLFELLNKTIRSLDGFEKFLYSSTSPEELVYPKELILAPITGLPIFILRRTIDPFVTAWYNALITNAHQFDKNNPNYIINNIPEFIYTDFNNSEFLLFLDMIGHHFDAIWVHINSLTQMKRIDESGIKGVPKDFVLNILKSFGWNGKRAFDSEFLWEYAFGQNKDGSQKFSISLEDANNQVWRRILNNLPYLLKHKGTARAMKAIMACYGVPQSMLTIMEFGGPQDPTKGGTSQFTFDDRTASLRLQSGSSVIIPWNDIISTGGKPQSIEFMIKPDVVETNTILISDGFEISFIQTTGSFVKFGIKLIGDELSGPYIDEPFISSSIETFYFDTSNNYPYAIGPQFESSSLEFPLSTEYYSNILISKIPQSSGAKYELSIKTSNGEQVIADVKLSILSDNTPWETGDYISIGNDFNGNLDEVRLWRIPLQDSKFENHTLFPDAINGNSITSSTADLMFRLDFERPKDRVLDPFIKNVAINQTYGENFATASNFYIAEEYPFQYFPYERTVTANVPSLGFNYANKIRFEEQELVTELSYKHRATKKSFDRAPVDSNRLGIFFSPIKELNMDIVKAFGDFNIDNFIGNPSDQYSDRYTKLDELRAYYFERLKLNASEYIQLLKYINKSLFDVLADLAPARAKVSKGLLIEPHFLERSKVRWDRPTADSRDIKATIDVTEIEDIQMKYNVYEGVVAEDDNTDIRGELKSILAEIKEEDNVELVGSNPVYHAKVKYSTDDLIQASIPVFTASISFELRYELLSELETFGKFENIGNDANSMDNLGFGLYAEDTTTIWKRYDFNSNFTQSRENVFLVENERIKNVLTQVSGYPRPGAAADEQVEFQLVPTSFKEYVVSLIPYPNTLSVGGTITNVTPLKGYFPTHYKFKNNLSEGLQRTFFKGSVQNSTTTPDGLSPVETFTTNPNILRVADTGRGSGEPILIVT